MAGTKDDWDQVGQRFNELKDRLAERYRAHDAKAGDHEVAAGASDGRETAEERRRKVDEALHTAREQLDRTFTAVGETIRDPETRESLNRAFSSLGSALASTLSEAGEGIRRTFGATSETDAKDAAPDPEHAAPEAKGAAPEATDASSSSKDAGSDPKDQPTA